MIEKIEDLYIDLYGTEPIDTARAQAAIEKAIYKGTDCGAWIGYEDDGVKLGSIVEGVEETTETHFLAYPFEASDFWNALERIEEEAGEIWDNTHGCEHCGDIDPWTGYRAVNPECPYCGGEGEVT